MDGEALVGWVTRTLGPDAAFPEGAERWIEAGLARRLLNPARAIFVAQSLFVVAVVVIAWGQIPPGALLPWAGLLGLTAAIRSGIPPALARRGCGVPLQLEALRWSVLVQGVLWGGGVALLAGSLGIERLLLLMVALTGMAAASAVTLAPDPPSFQRFAVPMLLGLVVGLLLHGQTVDHWLAAGLVVLFGLWVQTLLRQTHRALRHQLSTTADLKRHDEQAATERGYLIALLDSIPDAIVAMERSGRVLGVNRGFTDVFGWAPEEILDRDLFELIVPEDERRGARSEVAELLATGASVREVLRTRRDGTEAYMRVLTSPIHGLPGVAAILYSDITELKETEAALERARRAAEEANRAKSEFLATMSHEIRTPMNAIIGMADLLAETELDPTQRDYVSVFATAGETLLALINQILDLSRIEAGHLELLPRPFDLGALLEQVVRLFAVPAHEKGIELTAGLDPRAERHFLGDPDRLRQVLVNLLGNAIKFTKVGEIALQVEPTFPDGIEPQEGIPWALTFRVTDTGPGIPEDRIEAVFERFTQADSSTTREHGGSGLGLTISAALVELMGGRIGLESRVGEGSTFHFTIPLSPVEASEDGAAAGPRPDLRGVRALVVDDNGTNRLVLGRTLEGWGAEVRVEEGGPDALAEMARAREAGTPYDLVVLDGRMPGMDGFEVAGRVRSDRGLAGSTVMMLTSGGSQAEEIARAEAVGIDAYLVKPVRREELWERIREVLARSRGETAASDAGPTPDEPTRATDGPARILLVEDTEENRILIQAYLAGSPHELRMVERGEEAVRSYTETPEATDVIFMDIQMPGIDGYEATRRIRAWEREHGHPRVPIVALTAHALEDERRKSLDAGCDAHLTKPIRKDHFLEAVRAHARSRPEPSRNP